MFFAEIERQYTYWLHFFHENQNTQFIPLSWKVEDFIVMNMNKIDGFAGHFHSLNLKCAEKVKGFDPDGIFVEHLLVVGFNSSFTDTILNEDEYNALGSPTRDSGNLKTILSTNYSYKHKQKGTDEKSAQSPTATPKTIASRRSNPMAYPRKKVTHNSSDKGGDKNRPSGKTEISHKLSTSKNGKQ
jgi:hypothetical protein